MRIVKSLLGLNTPVVPDCEKRYSLNQIQRFENVFQKSGYSLRNFTSVLEFGCGAGRLLEHVGKLVPGVRISGCDVLQQSLDICKRKLPQGRFWLNQAAPPLECAEQQFDLIYSYSVFTHLSEKNHIAWLRELACLLKPGGVMLHTTKSYAFVRRAAFFSPQSLDKYQFPEPVEDFIKASRPYYYVMDNKSIPEYGLAIISREYVQDKWLEYSGLDFLDYSEGAIETYPEGCHDIVMLGKSPR